MKILYSWLKDFIDINMPPEELAKKLVSIGIEVASVEKTGANFTGVCVAEIQKIDVHPNADKLHLVDVNDGTSVMTVVCGAQNIAVGQRVPLAKVGAKLPDGELKKAKIRGVESNGMLCSTDELKLPDDGVDGIFLLPKDAPLGTDVAKMFGEPDCALDLEIVPNRPDLLSHFGIARELSVALGLPLRQPKCAQLKGQGEALKITIENPADCQRYCGRVLKNLRPAQSPDWLKRRLLAMGTNPKNALVDVTNYILYEMGQPLHAFDLAKLEGGEINVRRAREGEKFMTLDNKEIALDPGVLVIADRNRPVALAGVIGGLYSGIADDTSSVFLESACFNPPLVHVTARRFASRTEASKRFEGGVNPEAVELACRRAAELIMEICGRPQEDMSEVRDVYPVKYAPKAVEFTPEQINRILGTALPDEKIKAVAAPLSSGLDTASLPWKFLVPPHRRDIETRWDIAEDVVRFAGYDCVPASDTPCRLPGQEMPAVVEDVELAREELTALGFSEVMSYDLISSAEFALLGGDEKSQPSLLNPLSDEWKLLRPSLLPSLLRAFGYNERRGVRTAMLYEAGKVYSYVNGHPAEKLGVAGLMAGSYPADLFWRQGEMKETGFAHIKGAAERLLARFPGCKIDISTGGKAPSFMHPKLYAEVVLNGKERIG